MASFQQFTNRFTNNLERAIDQAFSNQHLNELGRQIATQIRIRTRSGYSVKANGASQQRLQPLSPDYVETRFFARRVGLLAPTTTPRRSNLTFTGNMLDSIIYKVANRRITFGFSNPKAEETASEVQSRGRPFFNLSRTEINKLTRQFNTRLRNILIRL